MSAMIAAAIIQDTRALWQIARIARCTELQSRFSADPS
jgi:hypothetical protein